VRAISALTRVFEALRRSKDARPGLSPFEALALRAEHLRMTTINI
jgi:hypothetical protein